MHTKIKKIPFNKKISESPDNSGRVVVVKLDQQNLKYY